MNEIDAIRSVIGRYGIDAIKWQGMSDGLLLAFGAATIKEAHDRIIDAMALSAFALTAWHKPGDGAGPHEGDRIIVAALTDMDNLGYETVEVGVDDEGGMVLATEGGELTWDEVTWWAPISIPPN